jgi:hypothetical protein
VKASQSFSEIPCRYFPSPGPANTGTVLEAVGRRAKELGIGQVVLATASGRTAFEARKYLDPSLKIIAVTRVTGFAEPNVQELTEADRWALQAQGVELLTCARLRRRRPWRAEQGRHVSGR